MSDNAVVGNQALLRIGKQLERARLNANWTQAELAERAGVSVSTLRRLEDGKGTQLSAALAVLRALGLIDAFLAALPTATPGPSEILEGGGAPRQRATGRRGQPDAAKAKPPFQWGDADPDPSH